MMSYDLLSLNLLIEEIVRDFLHPKPRSICICDKPSPAKFDAMFYAKCKTCGQDLSKERCMNMGILH